MVKWRRSCWLLLGAILSLQLDVAAQEQPGSIRGVVRDEDVDAPLPGVQVLAVETGQRVLTTDQGNFVFAQLAAGKYTLVFSKEGYVRQVKPDVVVNPGQLTDVNVGLVGEVTEMDEFVVQDLLQFGSGTEAALLGLRLQSPALMDSISSDLMSRAGAGDAASALKLVSGASLQNGKFAVIRGLPDRYVSSQMNGVVLPSADENTRAVDLDQFPAAVINSIQVTKTFTPDQQGDASGGAVDVKLKNIPDETILQLNTQVSYNSQVTGNDDFLTYDGGGIDFLGGSKGDKNPQPVGQNWKGAVGTTTDDAPIDYKVSAAAGGKSELDNGWTLGGFGSVFYEADSTFYDNGRNDSWWVTTPNGPMVPHTYQGTPTDGDFKTQLYDVTQGSQSVQWGGLGTLGIENDRNALGLTYLYTRKSVDTATLAEDTRGKEYFFPGYDPNDPTDPGNLKPNSAPYIRTETLDYTESTLQTWQLNGKHTLPVDDHELGDVATFHAPEVDWFIADSKATLDEPDKTQFGALWLPPSFSPGFGSFIPPSLSPPTWFPFKPGANFHLGNEQRIFKTIDEGSVEEALNLKLPFTQWSGEPGYLKFGAFNNDIDRDFNQDTFSNFADTGAEFKGGWNDPWSTVFPDENHPITPSDEDVDYKGEATISAEYGMIDLPLNSEFSVIGGARHESTELSIVNEPEPGATWFPPGSADAVTLNPGDADVSFEQDDTLPSLGLVYRPTEELTVRGSYSQTVARQTFKELTPILQQEFAGGPIFIGNPDLQMSALTNYDLRLDYVPEQGDLFSLSRFTKSIDDPIEYVQKISTAFDYTTPVNYPEGQINGYEVEVRQALGKYWENLEGLSVGANATFINSEVTLPGDEIEDFAESGIAIPTTRDMTNAPDHLYNFYLTYDLEKTKFALFYTVTGDTLVAGAGQANGNFVPSVYAQQYGTLNMTVSHQLSERATLVFQGKNLTNPEIEQVYKADTLDGNVTRTSYTKGREFTIGLNIRF